jgi:DNA-binding IclR family transcriptional regulator
MESAVLVKAFAALEALGAARHAMSLRAIARECGLLKPSAHRVLNDLVHLGYVERVDTGMYRLTGKCARLAAGMAEAELVATAEPALEALRERTGETANLGVLRGDRVVYRSVLESPWPLRRVGAVGAADPFHSTALGRAIAGAMDPAARDGLLAHARLEARTGHTTVDPQALRARLERAGRDGYAEEVEETDVGVMCIAAPVFAHGTVAGAVGVSAPSARVDAERHRVLIDAVRGAAEQATASWAEAQEVEA